MWTHPWPAIGSGRPRRGVLTALVHQRPMRASSTTTTVSPGRSLSSSARHPARDVLAVVPDRPRSR